MAMLACSLWLTAQQSNSNSAPRVDINGNVVSAGPSISQTKSANGSQTTVTTQSVNGRTVPLEQVEERVLRDDSSGKVTEKITRTYDPQGNPSAAGARDHRGAEAAGRRVHGPEHHLSGRLEREHAGHREIGDRYTNERFGSTSENVVQRLTPNGLQPVEKQSQVMTKQGTITRR